MNFKQRDLIHRECRYRAPADSIYFLFDRSGCVDSGLSDRAWKPSKNIFKIRGIVLVINVLVVSIILSTALENVDPLCHMINHTLSHLKKKKKNFLGRQAVLLVSLKYQKGNKLLI